MEKDTIDILWDVWNPAHYRILEEMSHPRYRITVEEQLDEIDEHLANGDRRKAVNEIIDLISIANNWLRYMGYSPVGIKNLIKDRAITRYSGKWKEIFDKYEKIYLEKE